MEAQKQSLLLKLNFMTNRLSKQNDFIQSIEEEIDVEKVDKVRFRAETLNRYLDEYSTMFMNYLECLTNDEALEAQTMHEDFSNEFYEVKSKFSKILEAHKPKPESNPENNITKPKPQVKVKLPEIQLPKFDGKIESWPAFRDSFDALVNSTLLPNIEKFYYLVLCCKGGEAENLLSMYQVTDANYIIACQALRDKYNDPKLLVDKHLCELLRCKPVSKDNPEELKSLLNCYSVRIKQLQQQVPNEKTLWNLLIVNMVSWRLDETLRKDWETSCKKGELPTWSKMEKFLEEKCRVYEQMSHNSRSSFKTRDSASRYNATSMKPSTSKTVSSYVTTEENTQNIKCRICSESHLTHECPVLLKNPNSSEREAKVRERKLCLNCLRYGHIAANCANPKTCRHCNMKHHSILHPTNSKSEPDEQKQKTENENPKVNNFMAYPKSNRKVLLSTAIIHIKDKSGIMFPARALLDNGSESCFVTERMAQILNLKKTKTDITVNRIGEESLPVQNVVKTQISSLIGPYSKAVELYVVPSIANEIPGKLLNLSENQIPVEYETKLADPKFYAPNKIDLIIGVEIFWEAIKTESRIVLNERLSLINSEFGYILCGSLEVEATPTKNRNCFMNLNQEINEQLKKFWEVENIEAKSYSNYSTEEAHCEELFQRTTTRDENGRFVVHLPLKQNVKELKDNRSTAVRRFKQLEIRLNQDDNIKKMYHEFMKEYIDLKHMVKVSKSHESQQMPMFYLPHHHVLKLSSTTTKLRVVFNASSKAGGNLSLNDILCNGPVIQPDIFSALIRFRQYLIAFVADIKMMFRQIFVAPEFWNLQRILMRFDEESEIQDWVLTTVTYGTASASFLAIRCLKQLAIEYRDKYPKAAEVLEKHFSMDDMTSGCQNIEEGIEIQKQLNEILKSAHFHLRKWMSNDLRMLENLDPADRENIDWNNEESSISILGLSWNPKTDKLSLIPKPISLSSITKRNILSTFLRWYDPLGVLNPAFLIAKLIMQKLWTLKIDWDTEIPNELQILWRRYMQEFPLLCNISFDRCYLIEDYQIVEFHGFSDASDVAYGACIYARSIDSKGKIKVQLMCAKSKVAPIEKETIPRLELLGAVLLSKLFVKMKEYLSLEAVKSVLWTDSTIVLCWLNKYEDKQQFIANRIDKIKKLTPDCSWKYVNTKSNPADIISRGMYPSELMQSQMWFHGPEYLMKAEEYWPECPVKFKQSTTEESCFLNIVYNEPPVIHQFKCVRKLKRIFGYVARFITNCKLLRSERNFEPVNSEDDQKGLLQLIKSIQFARYREEVKFLIQNKEIPSNSQLKSLDIFLDESGLIRVGGRLRNANISENSKHPIVLPNNHPVTYEIVRQCHRKNLHCNQKSLLSFIRQEYWPIRGKDIVRKVVKSCLLCQILSPRPIVQFMGDLPASRVNFHYPFYECGVDYGGPIKIKIGGPRSKVTGNSFFSVFICMATKAIHIELVSDLTTAAFMAALDRFIARRAVPGHIHSDNARNFTGASAELKALYQMISSPEFQNTISQKPDYEPIKWHFIPARSPHFGGLWESAVKLIKYHVARVIGQQILNFEELSTVLYKIEAIVNSRPITPESNDPNDLKVLTPAHFLVGRPLNAKPEINLREIPDNRLNRWNRIQKIVQEFWNRFYTEYLHQLQQRSKWHKRREEIQIDQFVALKEDNVPPMKWQCGRIIKLHPGKDGIVRVVTVKTPYGEYKRAVAKICPINIET